MNRNLKKKEFVKRRKGITLIALVITIIVLLILAGISISMLAGDNSILNRAGQAREKNGTTGTKEQIQIATMSALSNGNGQIKDDDLRAEIKKNISGVTDNDITGNERNGWQVKKDNKAFAISNTGNVNEAFWEEVKDENGNVTEVKRVDGTITGLKIGDIINYDSTSGLDRTNEAQMQIISDKTKNGLVKQTIDLRDYTGTWKLLGVQKGNLILISSEVIGNEPITTINTRSRKAFYFGYEVAYQNYEEELNKICSLFGNGNYAESARSINAEDINKITGYDSKHTGVNTNKATQAEINAKSPYAAGNLWQYGNVATFYWDGTDKPKYTSKVANGNLTNAHSTKFCWYDGNSWQSNNYKTLTEKICELKFDSYRYYPETLTEVKNEDAEIGIKHSSVEYNLLFGLEDAYFLSNICIGMTDDRAVSYSFLSTYQGRISDDFRFKSSYDANAYHGLRIETSC